MGGTGASAVISVHPSAEALAKAAAERFVAAAGDAVSLRDRFTVVLAGGSTPRTLYELLATPVYRERIPWERTIVLFGDERWVGPDDARSNYRMARSRCSSTLRFLRTTCTAWSASRAIRRRRREDTRPRCGACSRAPLARASISYCWAWVRTDTRRRCFPARRPSASRRDGWLPITCRNSRPGASP